ncbi:MAG: hypothetical protein Q8R55_00350 [Candidatus Taylorbacteria bacterium]|nr:hypothetical protein [Candidatus Taylorbacteria bacterium]
MKNQKQKELFLEQLKKMPIVEIACKNAGIGRATIYRWKKESGEFAKKMEETILDGEALITDMSESQLVSLIRDRNFPAIQLWLRQHHPKYATKVELSGRIEHAQEPLTAEEEALVREALRLALPQGHGEQASKNHE